MRDIGPSRPDYAAHRGLEALEPRQLLAVTFGPPIEITAPGMASAAIVVDLNGDHVQDLVVADGAGVAVYLNTGGHLGPRIQLADGSDPAVADADGDGDPDVFVRSNRVVTTLLNDGLGSFSPAGSFAEIGARLWFADLNGDGRADMITGVRLMGPGAPTLMAIRLGDGSGGFASAQLQGIISVPRSLAAADVNGDGFADLITDYAVLLNDGSGQFSEARGTILPASSFTKVVAADLNGDGRPDWAAESPAFRQADGTLNTGHLLIFTNTTVGDTVSYSVASFDNPSPTASITIADFNGDGRPDVLLAGYSSPVGGVTAPNPGAMGEVYVNDGSGGFERSEIRRVGPSPEDPAAWETLPAAIDLAGDGMAAVVAARPGVLGIFAQGTPAPGPRIASISFSPARATIGNQITIRADGVSAPGSSIASVAFYRDSNGNGVRDAGDEFLGVDAGGRGRWSIRFLGDNTMAHNDWSIRVSDAWGSGLATIFAVATDALGRSAEAFASVESLPKTPPTIAGLSIQPYTGWWSMFRLGPMAILEAQQATDVNGPVEDVSFYVDSNFDGRLDRGDVFLGASREIDGSKLRVRLKAAWLHGTQVQFLAVARDQDHQVSEVVAQTIDLMTSL